MATKIFLFAGALFALVFINPASAQTISIAQGNGQLTCDGCSQPNYSFFDDVVVLVTDASGNPLANVPVNWTLTGDGIQALAGTLINGDQTKTGSSTSSSAGPCDKIGQSCNRYPGSDTGGRVLRTVTITAALTNGQSVTFTLTETPQASNGGTIQNANVSVVGPDPNTLFRGTAGSTSNSSIQIQATAAGHGIPKVSLRLVPDPSEAPGGPTVTCKTQAGADPGSVLTDDTGTATCIPVFGNVPSSGQPLQTVHFYVLVGGVLRPQFFQNQQLNQLDPGGPAGFAGYFPAGRFALIVDPATPNAVQIISGNSQSAERGHAFAAPLVVKVVDANSPPNPLPAAAVTWTSSPAGAATVVPANTSTDANGLASTVVTLTSIATGSVSVTATTANGKTATFSLSVVVPVPAITGLTIVSSTNNQSVSVGQLFQPISVQVSTSAGVSPAGVPVNFTVVSGPVTLAQSSTTTNANGQAAAGVTAGQNAGPATISASVPGTGFSVSFTLTVLPPGINLTSANFLNGAGFFPTGDKNSGALSPCSIGMVVVGTQLTPATLPAVPNLFGAAIQQPTGASVTFNSEQAPILGVSGLNSAQALITFQVPCDVVPGTVPVSVTLNNASTIQPVQLSIRSASPGIFELPMSDGVRRAVAFRPDGTFVSLANPARRGETIRIYITGIGPASPPLATNALPTPGIDSMSTAAFLAAQLGSAGVPVSSSSRVSPSLIGVFELAVPIPADAPTGNNVFFEMGVLVTNPGDYQFANPGVGSKIPIQ